MDENEFLATLSDEQKTQYQAMKSNLAKQTGEDLSKKLPPKNNAKAFKIIRKAPSGLDGQAKAALRSEQSAVNEKTSLESSIKFVMGIGKFVKDNKSFLPEESEKMIELAEKQTFSSDVVKANTIRSGMLKAFCEKARFIDDLPQSVKDKVALYKSLAEDEKLRRASEFWDIIEIGVHSQTQVKRAKSKNDAYSNPDSYANKWKEKANLIYGKKDK